MSEQSKHIRVTSLLDASPAPATNGHGFLFWHVRFKLSQKPDRVWREIFRELNNELYDSKVNDPNSPDFQNDEIGEFGIKENEADVVVAHGATQEIPLLLKEIRETVRQTNAKYSKAPTEKELNKRQQLIVKEQIAEWKKTMEFDT